MLEAFFAFTERLIFHDNPKDVDFQATKQLCVKTYFVLQLLMKGLYSPLLAIIYLVIDLAFKLNSHLFSRHVSIPFSMLTLSVLGYSAYTYLGIGPRYIEEIIQDQKCEQSSNPYFVLAFYIGGHLLNLLDVALFN